MKKTKTPPTEEIEIEFLEVGDTLRYWDNRSGQQRAGKVESIGTKFIHVIVAKKLRKVRLNDEALFLIRGGQSFKIVGN
jgi:hypothetical protein